MRRLSASSEQLLHTIAAALPHGSVNVFDQEYCYIFAAGGGFTNVGLSPEQLVGRTLRNVFGADAAQVESQYGRAFAGEQVSLDLSVSGRLYALTVAPMAEAADLIVVLAQDVTDARQELRRHEIAEAALELANRQKDAFLAMALHELRQPLGPLRFGLESLKRSQGVVHDRTLVILDRQVQHLERLLIDLSDLARTPERPIEPRIERLDALYLLREISQELTGIMQARRHDVIFDFKVEAAYVAGDAGRLRQVFSNLLLNAATYTDPGGRICVEAIVHGPQLAISITDNGRGIDPTALPHIFGLFVRENWDGPGTGIGLHVVDQIVARHGGRIVASSQGKGMGSTFTVYLPLMHESADVI